MLAKVQILIFVILSAAVRADFHYSAFVHTFINSFSIGLTSRLKNINCQPSSKALTLAEITPAKNFYFFDMFKLTIFAFLAFVILSSCGKAHCGKASFTLGLVAFSNAESDTIILRRFDKSTNFSSEHDSLLIDTLNTHFQKYSDTTVVYYHTPEGLSLLTDEYDYEIFLPKPNSVLRLTDITYTNNYQASGEKQVCYAQLDSYKINGQLKKPCYDYQFIFIDK